MYALIKSQHNISRGLGIFYEGPPSAWAQAGTLADPLIDMTDYVCAQKGFHSGPPDIYQIWGCHLVDHFKIIPTFIVYSNMCVGVS